VDAEQSNKNSPKKTVKKCFVSKKGSQGRKAGENDLQTVQIDSAHSLSIQSFTLQYMNPLSREANVLSQPMMNTAGRNYVEVFPNLREDLTEKVTVLIGPAVPDALAPLKAWALSV
jgi:hypothetical protein